LAKILPLWFKTETVESFYLKKAAPAGRLSTSPTLAYRF